MSLPIAVSRPAPRDRRPAPSRRRRASAVHAVAAVPTPRALLLGYAAVLAAATPGIAGASALPATAASPGCAPAGRAILAEVFYDAVGDDSGLEFVELFNPSAAPVPLAGVRLEGGDGSGSSRWTLRWTGGAADTVRPRGRFVIGGARMVPAPHAVAALELQNGPDAVRLAWPDGTVEVVGWGAHEFAEYACGLPAPDAPSGQSLARVPDDADRGSNAADFAVSAPSPGASNQPGLDLALVAGSLATVPERPVPGAGFGMTARVVNAGIEAVAATGAELVASARLAGVEQPLARAPLPAGVAPGETLAVTLALPGLPAGRVTLLARVVAARDERAANDADSLATRIGPPPLEPVEIQYHPARGEGEWIELLAPGPGDGAPDGWQLSDRSGTRGRVSGSGVRVAPRERVVLAQDRRALLARAPALDTARVLAVSPWPSLNNSDDATGVADVIELREDDGTLAARVPYSARGVPAGVPLERDAHGAWRPGADAEGTPLAPPRELPPLAARFDVAPRRVAAGDPVRLDWDLPWVADAIVVRVFDLEGRAVATAHAARRPPARGGASWTPARLPPGLYVLALEARAAAGEGTLAVSRAVRVVEGGR